MNKAKEQLKNHQVEKIFSAVYASPQSINKVNIYCEIVS
jgi:hypothetical protein